MTLYCHIRNLSIVDVSEHLVFQLVSINIFVPPAQVCPWASPPASVATNSEDLLLIQPQALAQ